MQKIHPLILLGGAGARLWPISRSSRPKAFLPFAGDLSLAAQTIGRFSDERFAKPVLVASEENRGLISEMLNISPVGVPEIIPEIILEPHRRNTAAAIAVGACAISQRQDDALILVAPSDHLITDPDAFYDAVERAARVARENYVVAFGAKVLSAQTGYGYIEKGAPLENINGNMDDFCAIKNFVEKPSLAQAQKYIETGRFLWNAGIFLFRADVIRAQFQLHAPDILKMAQRALNEGVRDEKFLQLAQSFADVPQMPFDEAIMEKTDRGAVVPVNMGWRDIGSWRSLWEAAPKDQSGNVIIGRGEMADSRDCLIWNDARAPISVRGAEHLAIISTGGRVFVVSKELIDHIGEFKKDGALKD